MGENREKTNHACDKRPNPNPPSPSSSSSPSPPSSSSPPREEHEELQHLEHVPPFWRSPQTKRRILSKQLSMCEAPRNIAWEKRRRQYLRQERRRNGIHHEADLLTDEDLNELKGCIELGFGFNQQHGRRLCTTIPALDLYFAVNRQFTTSPISSPGSSGSAASTTLGGVSTPVSSTAGVGDAASSVDSPMSDSDSSWKILSPGDDPQHVKTKLRHWAQAVACSLRQSS